MYTKAQKDLLLHSIYTLTMKLGFLALLLGFFHIDVVGWVYSIMSGTSYSVSFTGYIIASFVLLSTSCLASWMADKLI